MYWLICWWKDHIWKYNSGSKRRCSRCGRPEKLVYHADHEIVGHWIKDPI